MCTCGAKKGARSAAVSAASGTPAASNTAATSSAQTPPVEGEQEAPKVSKPLPVLTQAQITKLETDFARRIIDLNHKISLIPAVSATRVADGLESSYQASSVPAVTVDLPLSDLLLKFRDWLVKETTHLSAKVERIVEESKLRLARAAEGPNSASLSGTPTTSGGGNSGHGSAIASTSTSTPR